MVKKNDCSDKAAFATAKEARAAATASAWRYGRDKNTRLVPYRCTKCDLYHLKTEYAQDEDAV